MAISDAPADVMQLTIRRPDDFHVHFRDGAMLDAVAPLTARQFARAVVMPNLKPPVRTVSEALAYRDRIRAALPDYPAFTPLMTLYLTDNTTAENIHAAHVSGAIKSCKLYPAGATTNSAHGVTAIKKIAPALAAMEKAGLVLCLHGESNEPGVDIFDKEADFVSKVLPSILADYPRLKIVLEHVTTAEAVRAVAETPGSRLAATITAHHLLYCRQAIFEAAKIHPHMFCLPVLKRETHRQALLKAIAGEAAKKFFAGTDSAPHPENAKVCAEGCAGIFTGCCAVELYAEAFEEAEALPYLEAFLSENGANFYGLELNDGTLTLRKSPSEVPPSIPVHGLCPVVPLRGGLQVPWRVSDVSE